jgi:hypothetical protein
MILLFCVTQSRRDFPDHLTEPGGRGRPPERYNLHPRLAAVTLRGYLDFDLFGLGFLAQR